MEKVNQTLNTTAAQIALELGYSKHAIIYCYEPNIRAGDLVMKILDSEERGVAIPFIDEEKLKQEDARVRLEALRAETLQLWKQSMCHLCWQHQAEMVALPCAHVCVCRSCVTAKCIICNFTVSDWIRVHT